jgi:hypothetical protein
VAEEIISQLALDTADQTHPVWVLTETEPLPPIPGMEISGPGDRVYVQIAASVTVTVVADVGLPTTIVPVRGVGSTFGRADTVTAPFDIPVLPEVTDSQGCLLTADHLHP